MADPITIGLMAAGTLVSASGTLASGKAADQAARFQAAQLEQRGKAEQAAASREAMEQRRQSRLVGSRARALMAASGGGIDYDILGDIAGEGEYRALTALYEGDEAAAGRRMQAAASRYEGKSIRNASRMKAFSTLLSGGSSIAGKYGSRYASPS